MHRKIRWIVISDATDAKPHLKKKKKKKKKKKWQSSHSSH